MAALRPVTSAAADAPPIRLPVELSPDNGLRTVSFVTVDKAISIRTDRLGPPFGRLATADMTRSTRRRSCFRGLRGEGRGNRVCSRSGYSEPATS